MALLLLIIVGAIIGWLASIIARSEAPRAVIVQIGSGVAVAVVAGTLANSGSILGGLSATALMLAVAFTSGVMVAYNLLVGITARA